MAVGLLGAGMAPIGAVAKNITVTFDEVDFATNGDVVDPLPADAYSSFGILMTDFYWGTDMRDPFGGAQGVIAGKFARIPTVLFLRDTPFVQFDFWTADSGWEIFVSAFDVHDALVGSFTGSGDWRNGGGAARIVGPRISYLTVLCREAGTDFKIGCGAVALSTLNFIRAPQPGTLGLLAFGLVGLVIVRRRIGEKADAAT